MSAKFFYAVYCLSFIILHPALASPSGAIQKALVEFHLPRAPALVESFNGGMSKSPSKTVGPSPPVCRKPPTMSSVMKSRTGSIVPWDALTNQILADSRAYLGNNYRLQKLVQKLQRGQGARIAVAGGSVTLGWLCEGLHSEEALLKGRWKPWKCAWSARLEEWLHAAYPDTPRELIQVVSLARVATTTQWAATFLGSYAESMGHRLEDFDLFICDYEINDQHAGRDMTKILVVSTEELLVQLLKLPQEPAVVFLFGGTVEMNGMKGVAGPQDPKFAPSRPWIEDEQMRVLRHYQVPALSWRDAFYNVAFSSDGKRHPLLNCHDDRHPTQCLHYVWAALVADLLVQQAEIHCRHAGMQKGTNSRQVALSSGAHVPSDIFNTSMFYSLPAARLFTGSFAKARGEYMSRPLSMLSVDVGKDNFLPAEIKPANGWQFREDVPGKPGWIVEGPGGGEEISFDVLFSRRITLGYLKSYENMGEVEVYVDKLIAPRNDAIQPSQPQQPVPHFKRVTKKATSPAMILDAMWEGKSSQYYQKVVINAATAKKPPMWVRVRLRRAPKKKGKGRSRGLNKFKLLAVFSH